MGVPQTRHRVFFIAVRNDLGFDYDDLDMSFNYEPILYKEFKSKDEKIAKGKMSDAIKQIRRGESIADCMKRVYGVNSGITHKLCDEEKVFPTQIAGHADMWLKSGNHPSESDVITSQTFPQDYDFCGQSVEYICGMSVPPIMIKRIVERLIESGIFDYKLKGE